MQDGATSVIIVIQNKSARDLFCIIILRSKKIKKKQRSISVKDLTEEITVLIKDEIVATYTEEDSALQVHFMNGQSFRLSVEEMKAE